MLQKNASLLLAMGYVQALLMALCGAAGIFIPDFYEPYLSRYGLAYSQVFVQDIMALLLAPVCAYCVAAARRGSPRAAVVWAGTALFRAYYFSFYGMDKLYTPLYPAYLGIIGLGFYSLLGLYFSLDRAAFTARIGPRPPYRFAAAVLGMTLLFIPLWLILMVDMIRSAVIAPAATVFLLDLSFLIPASLYAAALLWKRRAEAWLLGGLLLFKSMVSGILLSGGTLYDAVAGRPWDPAQLGLYLFLAAAGGGAFFLFLGQLGRGGALRETGAQGSAAVGR